MNAKDAVDSANKAAHYATDETPDGPRRLGAHVSAMRDAVWDSLRLRRKRISERCGNDRREQNMTLHATTPVFVVDAAKLPTI